MAYRPINEYGMVGDLHTAALIDDNGRVVWLPWQRFDSPSLFAALLDDQHGGDWILAPRDVIHSRQRYDDETAVLLTEFETADGRAELHDWMTPWDGAAPSHDLCRVLRCTAGKIEITCRFAPRPDYGRSRPAMQAAPDGLYIAAHDLRLYLAADRPWEITDSVATFRATLYADEELRCVLSSGREVSLSSVKEKLETTRRFWMGWIAGCRYDGLWPKAVRRSAITLKLLTYAPSGAIIAAATASLPEWIGGVRNWDYRYTWLRDASLTLSALYLLGFRDEALAFFTWLDERAQHCGTPLQIMYGVGGETRLDEFELTHLEGYRGSRPVRIGNAAYNQRQLDVYGGVVDAAYVYEREGDLLTSRQWVALRREIDFVCEHWTEPDHGIWEVRGQEQHYTFSKLMCWVTLDRGIRVAEMEGWKYDRLRWTKTRDLIHASILEHGWNEQTGAFTMSYESVELDASLLVMAPVGFLPPTDSRIVSTINAIDRELGRDALVYRYRTDDGLPGDEGAFLLCSYWMVDALAMAGRVDEAVHRFTTLLEYAGPQGLLSEQVHPALGMALGNYPQAFSHIGLINSAWRLTKILGRRDEQAAQAKP